MLPNLLQMLRPFHLDWLQVEVSARCEGRCVYCPVNRLTGRRRDGFMDAATFEALEPFFRNAELVFLQGWGEPLLHPRFWELVARARRGARRVGFTTNGVLLDVANRRALLESGVGVLGVSLAGATAATHDRYRPGSPLATIDGNLLRLREEKEAKGSRLPELHMAYLVLAGNAAELAAAVELAERWGATDVVVSHLSLVLDPALEQESFLARPDAWTGHDGARRQAPVEARPEVEHRRERDRTRGPVGASIARDQVDRARALAEARGIRLHVRAPLRERALLCPENVLRSCVVSVDGDVSPCVMTNIVTGDDTVAGGSTGAYDATERRSGGVDEAGSRRTVGADDAVDHRPAGRHARASRPSRPERRTGPSHRFQGRDHALETVTFGNVRDRSLREIWWSEAARSFRDVFRDRVYRGRRSTVPLPEPCRRCYKMFEG